MSSVEVAPDFSVGVDVSIIDIGTTPYIRKTSSETNLDIENMSYGIVSSIPDDNVAIVAENSYDWLCAWMALSRAGKTIILINYKLPAEQIEYCLNDSLCTVGFVRKEYMHLMPKNFRAIELGSNDHRVLFNFSPCPMPEFDPSKTNYIMYTSGTTGNPKGVVTSYKARLLQNKPKIVTEKPNKESVFLHVSPAYHLAGLNGILMNITGDSWTTAIMVPKFDVESYIKAIDEFNVTDLRLVAPMMSMILARPDLLEKFNVSSVKSVFLTSSYAPEKMQRDIRRFFTNIRDVHNPYGLTETGAVFGAHPKGLPRPPASAGYPLDSVEVRIVDGVLQVRSPTLLTEYHNKKDLFDKVMTEDGFFVTGDLFRCNKYGFYFYQGRADDMFKSGGEKIYPTEIESVIERHPVVAISCVVGLPDDIKGHKPYAFVQLKPGQTIDEETLRKYVINNVATYQIPRKLWILDKLPMTQIGKIDKRALAALAEKLLDSSK